MISHTRKRVVRAVIVAAFVALALGGNQQPASADGFCAGVSIHTIDMGDGLCIGAP